MIKSSWIDLSSSLASCLGLSGHCALQVFRHTHIFHLECYDDGDDDVDDENYNEEYGDDGSEDSDAYTF